MVANGVGVIDPDYSGPDRRSDDPGAECHRRRRAGQPRRPAGPGHRPARPRGSTWEEVTEISRGDPGWIRSHRAQLSEAPARAERCPARSSTSTWTRSTRRSSSATTRRCAAGRSPSAATRTSAASSPPPATRRATFGVRSAIPMSRAVRLCPSLVIVRPDFTKYRAVSQQVFELFRARHAAGRAALARRGLSRRHRERLGRAARHDTSRGGSRTRSARRPG